MNKKKLKFRNVIAIAICLTGITLFFAACNDKDLLIINDSSMLIMYNPFILKVRNIENNKGDIDFAKASRGYQSPGGKWHYFEFSSKCKNGGFELNFPATVPDEYLQLASEMWGVQLSENYAKMMSFTVIAYNRDGSNIGSFSFISKNWAIEYVYADRNFTEKGISKHNIEFDCSYRKGWNVVYWSSDGGTKRTTQKPLNEKFKCFFSYNVAY